MLGRRVAAGALEQGEVEDALYAAAIRNGQVADDDQRQMWATTRRGISAGLQDPIDLGDKPRSPRRPSACASGPMIGFAAEDDGRALHAAPRQRNNEDASDSPPVVRELPDQRGRLRSRTHLSVEPKGREAVRPSKSTAVPAVFRQAVDALQVRGVCGLIGAAPLGTEATFDMNSIPFGRTITGIIEGDSVPEGFIPRLIELYRQGRFPFDRLIRFYALDEINQAAEDSLAGTTLKPVLRMP